MSFRKLLAVVGLLVVAGTTMTSVDAEAETPFGPVESRAFIFNPGTNIPLPTTGCTNNSDWLQVKGANLKSVKSIEITPKTWASETQWNLPVSNACASTDTNCFQFMIKVGGPPTETAGPRTITLKHVDGRTVTTTFDVVANTTGRCDFKGGSGKK